MEIFKNMPLFVEVARASSFRRAAVALDMPNSTVSRRIAELERDVGLRLFNRSTRRVELTEGGRIYFEHCNRIIQEAQLAHQQLANMQAKPSGLIRASVPVDFSVLYLGPLLADFTMQYPDIRFELDLSPAQANLTTDPVDVAIRMGLPKDQNLIARQIADMAVGLFASPGYLKKWGVPKKPQDLLRHECLRMTESPWTLSHAKGHKSHSLAVSGKFVANNVGMLRQFALNDMGIMLTAESWGLADVAEHRLVRVLPEWSSAKVPVYALTTTRLLPAKVRVFVDYLVVRLARPANIMQ